MLLNWKQFLHFGRRSKCPRMGFSGKVGVFHEKPRLAFLLPWAFVDRSGIVHGKDHSLMAILKFRGPDLESSTPQELMQYNAAVNHVIKMLPTERLSGTILTSQERRSHNMR